MQAVGTQAIIPKARGMYAKRPSDAEYEELMRRRSVAEVAALLKKHVYFKDSLATLSTTEPHRGQIEELLNMDIFTKYEALVHYDVGKDSFTSYYLAECEVREIIKALHLLSISVPGGYLAQIPEYLVGKTRFDLFALARATNLPQVEAVLHATPYQKILRGRFLADPYLRDFPALEAAMLKYLYDMIFELIAQSFSGRERQMVRELFLQQAEIYNLQLMVRVKTYFAHIYPGATVQQLLLPYTFHLTKHKLEEMAAAPSIEAFLQLYKQSGAVRYGLPTNTDDMLHLGNQVLFSHARLMLHLTPSPAAALAAFLALARLIRENVINIIEGVRYGLAPETMSAMMLN